MSRVQHLQNTVTDKEDDEDGDDDDDEKISLEIWMSDRVTGRM